MASTRLKGNTLAVFSLSALSGSPSAISGGEDLVSINLTEGDAEAVTFGDFASGDQAFAFEITAVYSGDSSSWYDVFWKNSGRTGVGFVFGPHGNTVAAAGKPVYSGTLTMPPKPTLEVEASAGDPVQFTVTAQVDTITRATV